ncbi:hypothetical protein GGS26DRAFT_555183 [Hypomontagnella submonticulosa]|nr:hypothetical protein GGS26DRAFT_555183 [Hypomontagnella submonticulosa]
MELPSVQASSMANLERSYGVDGSTAREELQTTCLAEYKIPGYLVNPENLVRVLREKFNDNYKVKLRNDNYLISTPKRLTQNELVMCY